MQNTDNTFYINNSKVINLKSEILYRESEDDLFYFNNINKALKKLEKAIELTPFHTKSLMLCADIYFITGKFKKSLNLYLKALTLNSKSARILAGISNCHFVLKQFNSAVYFADKALEFMDIQNYSLYYQLLEIKINSLVEMKNYKLAYITFIQAQNILDRGTLQNIYNYNFDIINEKLKLQKKIKHSGLKIV